MSQIHLTYCCSNPECHTNFTIEEAEQSTAIMKTNVGNTNATQHIVPLVHILCPKCKNIVTSVHIPADSI